MRETQIRSRVLADEVTRVLEEALADGYLKAGDRINEAEWAARLGVSRSPVREAIRRLAQGGLVVLTPQRGAFVPRLSKEDVRELYLLRASLEGLAAYLTASRITETDLAHLDWLIAAMSRAKRNTEAKRNLDFDFHEYLYTLSGHRRLIEVMSSLRAQIRGFIRANQVYTDIEELVQQHITIVEALRRHDPDEARRLVEDHIISAGRLVEEALEATEESRISHGA